MIVGMYDMGNRFIEDRLAKANITFSEMWGSAHEGRFLETQAIEGTETRSKAVVSIR